MSSETRNLPQLYIRLRTFLTDSLSRTLSEVTGQIPPFARVAAITDLPKIKIETLFLNSDLAHMLSVVISREHS